MGLLVDTLELRDWRNFEQRDIAFSPTMTVLHGHNAVGKTNTVEALQLLTAGASFRKPRPVQLVREGAEGAALIERIMDAFREGKPQAFGPFKVRKTSDYIHGYEEIPASNVLRFDLGDGTWFASRPSGTEPKIKFYYYAVADNKADSAKRVEEMKQAVDELIRKVS